MIKTLYIFGGMVESSYENIEHIASKEMWRFAVDAKKWTGPMVSVVLLIVFS